MWVKTFQPVFRKKDVKFSPGLTCTINFWPAEQISWGVCCFFSKIKEKYTFKSPASTLETAFRYLSAKLQSNTNNNEKNEKNEKNKKIYICLRLFLF